MTDNRTTRWRVVATNLKTRERRVLTGCDSEADAEAIVRMAVMRRGVDEEFFTAEEDHNG
jgi:hypothetical protein